MSFKILTVPFEADKECFMEEELSRFCLNKKIEKYGKEVIKIIKAFYPET